MAIRHHKRQCLWRWTPNRIKRPKIGHTRSDTSQLFSAGSNKRCTAWKEEFSAEKSILTLSNPVTDRPLRPWWEFKLLVKSPQNLFLEQILPELLTHLIYYPEILHQSPLSAFPFSPNICSYNGKHSARNGWDCFAFYARHRGVCVMFQRDRRRRSIAVIIYLPSFLYAAIIAFIIAAALVLRTFRGVSCSDTPRW